MGVWRKKETTAETPYRAVNVRSNRAVQNLTPVSRLVELLNYKSRLVGVRTDRFDERGSTRFCVAVVMSTRMVLLSAGSCLCLRGVQLSLSPGLAGLFELSETI